MLRTPVPPALGDPVEYLKDRSVPVLDHPIASTVRELFSHKSKIKPDLSSKPRTRQECLEPLSSNMSSNDQNLWMSLGMGA